MPHTDEIVRSAVSTLLAVAMPILAGCSDAGATHAGTVATQPSVVHLIGAPRKPPL